MQYYLAIDIGASSGRHILGWVQNGRIELEEVYRFDNIAQKQDGHLCWDIDGLYAHVLAGLRACKAAGKIPATVGIDTWGVDFVLVDGEGRRVGQAVAYRDERGQQGVPLVEQALSQQQLYARTGIQKQPFNTIYQLAALRQQGGDELRQAKHLLMIPDYLNWKLCGVPANEYTNATTTAMVDAETKAWDAALLEMLGYPAHLMQPPAMPGAVLGQFSPEVQAQLGFCSSIVLPATHDTASAFLAVPAKDDSAVYISSGTWSLLGVEQAAPVLTPQVQQANFSNEGGYNGRFRFLKNIMGLWMIQSIRRDLGKQHSFAQLEEMAVQAGGFAGRVDVNDESFLAPASMVDAVKAYCQRAGQPVPQTTGEVMQCVYASLAASYAGAIAQLQGITGKSYTSINIVGGGSKDGYLNQLTANAAGLPVFAGPTEGTALGNLMVQFIAAGLFDGLQEARRAVRASFDIREYKPQEESRI